MFDNPQELQDLMDALGFRTQRDFAKAVGIDAVTMNRLLRGRRKPGAKTLKRLLELKAEAERPLAVGAAALAEERLASLYGRLRPEQISLLERVLANPEGRRYLLLQAHFWLSQQKK